MKGTPRELGQDPTKGRDALRLPGPRSCAPGERVPHNMGRLTKGLESMPGRALAAAQAAGLAAAPYRGAAQFWERDSSSAGPRAKGTG